VAKFPFLQSESLSLDDNFGAVLSLRLDGKEDEVLAEENDGVFVDESKFAAYVNKIEGAF